MYSECYEWIIEYSIQVSRNGWILEVEYEQSGFVVKCLPLFFV